MIEEIFTRYSHRCASWDPGWLTSCALAGCILTTKDYLKDNALNLFVSPHTLVLDFITMKCVYTAEKLALSDAEFTDAL